MFVSDSLTDPMVQRWNIHFCGDVQGVGFRYTAVRAAQTRPVTGWVRNLADRRVQMVAEGDAEELLRFVEEVCQMTYGNVTEHTIEKGQPTGEFTGFEVRR